MLEGQKLNWVEREKSKNPIAVKEKMNQEEYGERINDLKEKLKVFKELTQNFYENKSLSELSTVLNLTDEIEHLLKKIE